MSFYITLLKLYVLVYKHFPVIMLRTPNHHLVDKRRTNNAKKFIGFKKMVKITFLSSSQVAWKICPWIVLQLNKMP